MDPVEPNIQSFVVKVWQEVVVGEADGQGWRGYITHVPSGTRRYFQDLAEILAFVQPTLAVEAAASTPSPEERSPESRDAALVKRVRASAGGAGPDPEEVEMDSTPSGLDALQEQLKTGNEAVDGYATEAAVAQARLKQAQETQAALQQAIDQVKTSTTAIEKAVAAAIGPTAAAEKTRADIAKTIDAELTDDQRTAVTKVVTDADERRKTLVDARSASAKAIDGAQRNADAASAASSAAAAELAAAQTALKGHGASIQELTVLVTALGGAAKAAVAAKRPGAAFRLSEQLESALGRLGDLTDPGHPKELQQQIADALAQVGEKATVASKANEALTTATNAFQEADAKVKADDAARESTIDQQIASLEQQWAAKPSGSRAAAGAGPSAAGATQPAAGATQPAAGATQPAAGATQPAAGATQPAAGATQSAAGATQSAAGADQASDASGATA